MKHFYTFFILFLVYFNLNANSLFEEYQTKITEVKDDLVYFEDSNAIEIGASGIIVRQINSEMTLIISKIEVISKENSVAIAKVSKFTALKHEKLPTLNVKPKVNDEVVLNYLYDKAIAIVPNLETLEDLKNRYKDLGIVHPDILTAELIKSKDESPSYENFEFTCQKTLTNLLYIAIEDKGYFVDCNSFKILREDSIKDYKKEQTPYYTRVKEEEIDAYTFGFGNSSINDYNRYYLKLLRAKNGK